MPDRMEHVDFLMVLQLNIVVKNSCQHAELSSLRHTLCFKLSDAHEHVLMHRHTWTEAWTLVHSSS